MCGSQRVCIWYHRTHTHEELHGVLWVAARLVLVGCDVQEPHAIYLCYEEVLMRGNPTVWNFCGGGVWGKWSFKNRWLVYWEEVRTSWFMDPFIADMFDTWGCGFIKFDSHAFWVRQPKNIRQRYRRHYKWVVTGFVLKKIIIWKIIILGKHFEQCNNIS